MATDQDLSQKNKASGWGDGAACKAILCEYEDLSLDPQTHVYLTPALQRQKQENPRGLSVTLANLVRFRYNQRRVIKEYI